MVLQRSILRLLLSFTYNNDLFNVSNILSPIRFADDLIHSWVKLNYAHVGLTAYSARSPYLSYCNIVWTDFSY